MLGRKKHVGKIKTRYYKKTFMNIYYNYWIT